MTKAVVMALIAAHSLVEEGMRAMVASMCPMDLSEADLIAGIRAITFDHTPSSAEDDDEHWVAQSPFDGKYYHFAASPAAAWPTRPEITDLPPKF